MGALGFTGGIEYRDVIVFTTLRFRRVTWVQQNGVFTSFHSGEGFWEDTFLVTVFTRYLWTTGQTGFKKTLLKKPRFVWTGPCPIVTSMKWPKNLDARAKLYAYKTLSFFDLSALVLYVTLLGQQCWKLCGLFARSFISLSFVQIVFFPLFLTNYHTLYHTPKQREIKIKRSPTTYILDFQLKAHAKSNWI